MRSNSLVYLLVLISWFANAQQTTIKGQVKEALTGTPIPFANVVLKGTTIGTTTDFDGLFTISTQNPSDSIEVSYIGFLKKAKPIQKGAAQSIDFQLEEDVVNLEGVLFLAGENPAFPILRKVVENKDRNDKRSLDAYEYEAYTKNEFDVNNMSEKFKQRKLVQKVRSVLDSIEIIAGEDGEPVLPIFISEAISRFYYKKQPTLRHENVLKTNISGVGIEDGSLTSQVIGSTFQEYNFYNNWLNIVSKEFASPIGDFWKANYEYDLIDSLYIDDKFVYRIDYFPKREQDLAFRGSMWITKDEYALRRIDASVDKVANLNFVRRMKVQQDLLPTQAGPWLPEKTRVVVEFMGIGKDPTGFIAKFYVSNKDIIVNEPRPDNFYLHPIEVEEDYRVFDDSYWNRYRHEPLSETEVTVFSMIDTLKTIPQIKRITDIVQILGTGYWDVGAIDLGPWWILWGNNNIEGIRLGFGARTNPEFSRKVELWGDVAHGLNDKEWKYGGGVNFFLSRNRWTVLALEHRKEIDPVWVVNDDGLNGSIFRSFARFGTLESPFRRYTNAATLYSAPAKGLSTRLKFKKQDFTPLEEEFGYFREPGNSDSVVGTSFQTSEVGVEIRYAKDELFVIDDNDRISLGTVRSPAITLKYTAGLKEVLGSDFDYHRLGLTIEKKIRMGGLGGGKLKVDGGYLFGQIPYPLLKTHIGNEFPVYYEFAFNQMDFFEFASDKFVELKYFHRFEGFLLNRIPLMKKLKWRLFGIANMAMGSVRDENKLPINVLQPDENDNPELPFNTFDGSKPYLEMGGGIENIFKFFYFGVVQRLTYLDRPEIRKTGFVFGIQFIL
ncbi:MAG: DUF5686 family protein [Cyclobacteriaceae bacterium]